MGPNKLSSEHIENEVLNLTSETSSSVDCFETKIETNFDESDQIFEQQEE